MWAGKGRVVFMNIFFLMSDRHGLRPPSVTLHLICLTSRVDDGFNAVLLHRSSCTPPPPSYISVSQQPPITLNNPSHQRTRQSPLEQILKCHGGHAAI